MRITICYSTQSPYPQFTSSQLHQTHITFNRREYGQTGTRQNRTRPDQTKPSQLASVDSLGRLTNDYSHGYNYDHLHEENSKGIREEKSKFQSSSLLHRYMPNIMLLNPSLSCLCLDRPLPFPTQIKSSHLMIQNSPDFARRLSSRQGQVLFHCKRT